MKNGGISNRTKRHEKYARNITQKQFKSCYPWFLLSDIRSCLSCAPNKRRPQLDIEVAFALFTINISRLKSSRVQGLASHLSLGHFSCCWFHIHVVWGIYSCSWSRSIPLEWFIESVCIGCFFLMFTKGGGWQISTAMSLTMHPSVLSSREDSRHTCNYVEPLITIDFD